MSMIATYCVERFSLRLVFTSFLFISFSILTLSAFAATPLWQGPYVGAYLGGAFGNNHVSTNTGVVTDTSFFTTPADISAVNNAGSFAKNPGSVIAGIQAGHDWVWMQMVYGIILDYGVFSLKSSKSVTNTYPDNRDVYSVHTALSTDWLFTLRGRLGYETVLNWPTSLPTLLYVTGGAALTKLKINNNFSDNSAFVGTGGSSASEYRLGWTLGAGAEFALFCHTFLNLEYLYVHVPSIKTTSSIANTEGGFGIPVGSLNSPFSTSGKLHASLLKIGLNYKFDE